jgi:hypothetical protein
MTDNTDDAVLEDVDVLLEDGKTPEAKTDEPKVEKTAEEPPAEPEDPLAKLKAQLAEEQADKAREKAAREAAERRANELQGTAVRAQTDKQESDIQLVTTAIEAAKQALAMAKAQYAEAAAAGDWEAAGNAQEAIAEATNKKIALENGLVALKAQPKPRPEPIIDPVEQVAQTLTPKSAAWVRAHPETITDPRLNQRLLAAHNMAVTDGIATDTPEYFAAVEAYMGLTPRAARADAVEDDALSDAARPVGARTPPAAAPVTRNGSPGAPRPGTVRLTAAEREAAHFSFPNETPQEAERQYALQKLALEKEQGRMQ